MSSRPGVLFRFEFLDAIEQLDPADAGQLFLGAMHYGKDGALPIFQNPLLAVIWPFVKNAVDRDGEVYNTKILQKRYAVYVREAKKSGLEPEDFDSWKASADITRCQPISGDIHNQYQEHTQYQNHSQIQEQEHTQAGSAAVPPALARDSRNLIYLDDGQYSALVGNLGEQETRRCIDYLSEYCSTHGKQYHDWPTMIRRASRERWGIQTPDQTSTLAADFQPSAERIRKNSDWLDSFLAEQQKKNGVKDWGAKTTKL